MWACPLSLAQELLRRRRERRAKAKLLQGLGYAGYANGNGHDVMGPPVTRGPSGIGAEQAKKLWQHSTHLAQPYPYITQYPAYRGYPMYID